MRQQGYPVTNSAAPIEGCARKHGFHPEQLAPPARPFVDFFPHRRAMPPSAEDSSSQPATSIAAPARFSCSAMLLKLVMNGPKRMGLCHLAGSNTLCPPASTRLPPTNATSPSAKKSASSPTESSSKISLSNNCVAIDPAPSGKFESAVFQQALNLGESFRMTGR